METLSPPCVEWAVASRPLNELAGSGDGFVVRPFPGGVLVGVVDGLGHGHQAAAVARIVQATLEGHAGETALSLLMRCHDRLRGTRGATLSLASFDARDATMTWLGVGNVEGALLRAVAPPRLEILMLRNGVLGLRVPPVRGTSLHVQPGDTLAFVTDGIRIGFASRIIPWEAPKTIAEGILAEFDMGTDDALVLVARYVGVAA